MLVEVCTSANSNSIAAIQLYNIGGEQKSPIGSRDINFSGLGIQSSVHSIMRVSCPMDNKATQLDWLSIICGGVAWQHAESSAAQG